MKIKTRQFVKQGGSALILVVVVTVLLAVVGVMFMMVSRASEMESGAAIQNKDLDSAVDTVVQRINVVLVEDLFGLARVANTDAFKLDDKIADADSATTVFDDLNIYADEPSDYPTHTPNLTPGPDNIWGTPDDVVARLGVDVTSFTWDDSIDPGSNGVLDRTVALVTNDDIWLPGQIDDFWLASLEPTWRDDNSTPGNPTDDIYVWPHITDLWGTLQGRSDSLYYQRYIKTDHIYYPQETRSFWVDPDDETIPAQWNAFWQDYEVSVYNVPAKIIAPKDRMKVILQGATGTAAIPDPWDDKTQTNIYGARADADGDGVADSRWVQVPSLTTSRGEPIFAAVRIIDNCGMLNLNGAHCFYQEPYDTPPSDLLFEDSGDPVSPFEKSWFVDQESFNSDPANNDFVTDYNAATNFADAKQHLYHKNDETGSGRYLTEINYLPFLRGSDLNGDFFGAGSGDNWYDLMLARGMYDTGNNLPFGPAACNFLFEQVDDLSGGFRFFDISDELELRNRYLLTSSAESQIEQKGVLNYTLDSGGADYAALQVPIEEGVYTYFSGTLPNFNKWKFRLNPDNFDKWSGAFVGTINGKNTDYSYRYDRRHVCTVYSFDRTISRGIYPQLSGDTGAFITAYIASNGVPAGYTNAQYRSYLEKWVEPVFKPVGPVTTNIENLAAVQPYNNIETKKRILHLLYALRGYYIGSLGLTKNAAAVKAAQVVANLIDYSDDYSANDDNFGNADGLIDAQGPFYDKSYTLGSIFNIDYGQQANADCTFITKQIVDQLIVEVSRYELGVGNEIDVAGDPIVDFNLDFGLTATDIVFGYERQPFISEIFANWDGAAGVNAALQDFAVELVNPYPDMIDIQNWRIKIGTTLVPALSTFNASYTNTQWQVPGSAPPNPAVPGAPDDLGYAILHGTRSLDLLGNPLITIPGGVTLTDSITNFDSMDGTFYTAGASLEIQLLRPAPQWVQNNFPDPTNPGVNIQYIIADRVSDTDVRSVLGTTGQYNLERDDDDWKFIYGLYAPVNTISAIPTTTYTMVTDNAASIATITNQFQIGVPDDGLPLARWHDLEILGLHGNEHENSTNADAALTTHLANMPQATGDFHFNLTGTVNNPSDYLCTINRPENGTLPGRININTAPVYVIAAAIPPSLADPDTADPGTAATSSALQLAQQIVAGRPYTTLGDLLTKVTDFKQYASGGAFAARNVGMQSIRDDIEEEHWILSNLANKFTVRSDVFTAYILVRLGEDGPQRRMIGIFDRSQVWDKNDRPKLVALHPVPDPR